MAVACHVTWIVGVACHMTHSLSSFFCCVEVDTARRCGHSSGSWNELWSLALASQSTLPGKAGFNDKISQIIKINYIHVP